MALGRWMVGVYDVGDILRSTGQPTLSGLVATSSALPAAAGASGQSWMALDTRHVWLSNGTTWADQGQTAFLEGDLRTMSVGDIGRVYNLTG